MSYFKDSLEIVEKYKLKHERNGYFGRFLWRCEPPHGNSRIECWDTAEQGRMIFEMFKSAAGLIVYKPEKVR